MSSLEQSLRLKAAGVKGPSKSGPRLLNEPELQLQEGKSGGIAKSKQVKNAGSSPVNRGYNPKAHSSRFLDSLGGQTQSDKTTGYF